MLDNKRAAIFDLDGTLVDSMNLWKDIDIAYLAKHHLLVPPDLQQAVEGLAFTEVAEYFKNRFSLEDSIEEIKREWNQMAMEHYQYKITLKPGVMNFLLHLKERGYSMGVASSNSIELVQAALRAHKIDTFFSCVLTCCEVAKGKPAPDVYLEAARRLKVSPDRCIVFEDIPAGLTAGKTAGMEVCAIYDDYSAIYEEEKRSLADYYIHSYDEILKGTYEKL